MVRLPLVPVLFTAALATAQSQLVLPASHATVDGSTSTNVPFGRSSAVRVQCAYDSMLFSGAGTITQLAFRLDANVTGAGKAVDCEVHLSTMPAPLVAMSATYAQNRGADDTVVIPRQVITLAGQTTAALPSPFLPPIPLAVPFYYNPQQGPLLLDILVYGQPPGAYTLDATYVCDSPEQAFGPVACAPVGLPLRVESANTQVLWGYPWSVRTLDAPAGSLVMLAMGNQESGVWNGLPLPYDLAAMGAPNCFVATDPSAVFFRTSLGDGSALFSFAVPNVPGLIGTWLRYQAGAIVPGANALGVVTSQGKKLQICGFEPVARVWGASVTATAGVRELGVAPVVRVTMQ